jgi:hypothetical protein
MLNDHTLHCSVLNREQGVNKNWKGGSLKIPALKIGDVLVVMEVPNLSTVASWSLMVAPTCNRSML